MKQHDDGSIRSLSKMKLDSKQQQTVIGAVSRLRGNWLILTITIPAVLLNGIVVHVREVLYTRNAINGRLIMPNGWKETLALLQNSCVLTGKSSR